MEFEATNSGQELTHLNATEASRLLQKRSASPVDLTHACLAQCERLNPVLNAFITVIAESDLEEARNAEAEILRGEWKGQLHGIPVAIKDMIETAGVRTTAGSAVFEDYIPRQMLMLFSS